MTATPQRSLATAALQQIAAGGRLHVQDPTVRATISELAALGMLRKPPVDRTPKTTSSRATVYELRALAFEGWSPDTLGRELGIHHDTLMAIRNGKRARVKKEMALLIHEFYEAAPTPNLTQKRVNMLAETAHGRGWLNRRAWEIIRDVQEPA